jgi:ABC-2 type transport system ATP-binding protein
MRGADRARRVSQALDEVSIGAERQLKLRSYSKGMIQRIGVAQAVLNEPSLLFLDEPMSGLDPLGRRDLRQLMLRLRDRGCTIFFSSHILSDAEALCSRVGIVAQGRLVAHGRLAELVAFATRGWELVVAKMPDHVRASLAARIVSLTPLANDRYTLELSPSEPPERMIQELARQGVHVVSLNPIRTTLEDYFVSTIGAAAPRDASYLRKR